MRPTGRGYSLIEMLVVLAVAAILLAVGVPGFRAMLENQRVRIAANDFFIALNVTRSEAIQRGRRVDLVPADGLDWASGWVIFVDADGNRKPDAGEAVVFRHPALRGGLGITSRLTDSGRPYLAYTASGRTRTDAHEQVAQSGSWEFTIGRHSRRVVLNFLGRARVENPREPAS